MTFASVPSAMYDRDFARLSAPAQVIEFYLRTCPQRASEGLFRFGPGTASDELGMERDEIETAMSELLGSNRGFMYDDAAGVILDCSALKTNPIGRRERTERPPGDWKVDKRVPGAIRKLQALPKTPLLKHLLVIADDHSPELAGAMRDAFPDIEAPLGEAPSEAPSTDREAPFHGPSEAPSQGASREESSRDEGSRVVADAVGLVQSELGGEVVEVRAS